VSWPHPPCKGTQLERWRAVLLWAEVDGGAQRIFKARPAVLAGKVTSKKTKASLSACYLRSTVVQIQRLGLVLRGALLHQFGAIELSVMNIVEFGIFRWRHQSHTIVVIMQ
jgi:hypothetical protein